MMRIAIINGPNLNLLGTREPGVYGSQSFESFLDKLRVSHPDIEIQYFQSNIEGELVNFIQQSALICSAIILNAAAYTHTSIAIADAVKAIALPVIEVHISNIYAREPERHSSLLSAACVGSITGLGLNGYNLAILHFKSNLF
jgi:3-dehydroquinate dehydratase II